MSLDALHNTLVIMPLDHAPISADKSDLEQDLGEGELGPDCADGHLMSPSPSSTNPVSLSSSSTIPPHSNPQPQIPAVSASSLATILRPSPQSNFEFFVHSHKKFGLLTTFSVAILSALLPPSTWFASKLNWNRACVYAFIGMLIYILQLGILRGKDKKFAKEWRLWFPSAIIVSLVMLTLTNGDTGYLTAPLIAAMFSLSGSSKWLYESSRPNPLIFYLKRIPTAVVCTILSLLPPYAVAVPGISLSSKPIAYTMWCGFGFPFLSFLMRLFIMNYFSNYAKKLVKSGRMSQDRVVPFLSTISFGTCTSLMFGNTILLYLSQDIKYASMSSAFAILTELVGKIYTCILIDNKKKVKKKIRGKVSRLKVRTAKVAAMATGTPDSGASDSLSSDSLASSDSHDSAVSDSKIMFAVRVTNEIVSEKVCIIVCGIVTLFFVDTPHSGLTITVFAFIFLLMELIGDAIVVYVLDSYFDIPILRLPVERFEWDNVEFLRYGLEISLVPVIGAFFFLNAYMEASVWFLG
jgi:uncharacterized membrane protein